MPTLDLSVSAQRVLVPRDLVALPEHGTPARADALATVLTDIAYYGYALSAEAFDALRRTDDAGLVAWWRELEPVLAVLTGADKEMDRFVVYRNFPDEVLAMDDTEYWTRQLLMYWGLPNEYVTQPARERPALADAPAPRVLHAARIDAFERIRAELFAVPARWTWDQWQDVEFVVSLVDGPVHLGGIPFVENRIRLAAWLARIGSAATVDTATDVLRLAAALSDHPADLRVPPRLGRFTRRERRFLLGLLERAGHLDEDVARRPEMFKRLFHALRPGDYAAAHPRVVAAYDRLYRGDVEPGFASTVERLLAARDRAVLTLLATRPGEFVRRLRVLAVRFRAETVPAFGPVAAGLTTIQLLKIRRYLSTVHTRQWRMFPPNGDWSRVQVVRARAMWPAPDGVRTALLDVVDRELGGRLATARPVALDPAVARVKLPTNDAELAPYGRGTVFPFPERITFLRTAVYWKSGPTRSNIWYDNGWNFFGPKWQPRGACCWNARAWRTDERGRKHRPAAAVFSGDPTNSKDLGGRACQLIDLYLDKLEQAGIRYAVWSVLCYSKIRFSEAEEVFAALQWGEQPSTGRLFEPSRCQLAFPLAGDDYTKFVATVDVVRRQLVYLDANLPVRVVSAAHNGSRLATTMPAYAEYLDTLPSVHDLFRFAPTDPDGMPVRYDDVGVRIDGGPAYVFRPTNTANKFEPFDPASLL